MKMSDKWKDLGSSAPIADAFLPGGYSNWVENTETGDVKEVVHNGDVGEGIEVGRFTDREFN